MTVVETGRDPPPHRVRDARSLPLGLGSVPSPSPSEDRVPSAALDDRGFRALVDRLVARGPTYAPRVRDLSIVLEPVGGAGDLAEGVTLDLAPGSCRIRDLAPGDGRRFAWAVGPASPKVVQHPPSRRLFRMATDGSPVVHEEPAGPDVALVGVRPCDVAAMAGLRRVLGDATGGGDLFVVVVDCTEPGGTCFCSSMGTGPDLPRRNRAEVDVELWERPGEDGPRYLVGHTSKRGAELVDSVGTVAATAEDHEWVSGARADALERMGRHLPDAATQDGAQGPPPLADALLAVLESDRWDQVARRCLSCGNCTMVCPTCFCHSVHDVGDLSGSDVERWTRWDSCFSLEHSYVHGGSIRATTADRYRQWLTHKLSTWWGQFGESGCVGCGRCIAWCPVGIDIVEEARALHEEGTEVVSRRGPAATQVFLRTQEAPA